MSERNNRLVQSQMNRLAHEVELLLDQTDYGTSSADSINKSLDKTRELKELFEATYMLQPVLRKTDQHKRRLRINQELSKPWQRGNTKLELFNPLIVITRGDDCLFEDVIDTVVEINYCDLVLRTPQEAIDSIYKRAGPHLHGLIDLRKYLEDPAIERGEFNFKTPFSEVAIPEDFIQVVWN